MLLDSVFRILIVEDHPIFLKGLAQLLSRERAFAIVAEAAGAGEALAALIRERPHVVIMDLSLGDDDGLDLIKRIREAAPDTRILVLSMHDERLYAERSLAAGANGYCMKTAPAERLVDALKAVASGHSWLSPDLEIKIEEFRRKGGRGAGAEKLSDREFQVFDLIGRGLGTTEIAAKLKLSAKTVDTHKENVKAKLHCASAMDLRQYAIEWRKRYSDV
jgi:DNA-binding NarL/FixJ family response regulator